MIGDRRTIIIHVNLYTILNKSNNSNNIFISIIPIIIQIH